MTTSEPRAGEQITDVHFTEDTIGVDFLDGRSITVPLAWYPRLEEATRSQRENWKVCGGGYGIEWEEIDEHLSTEGLLKGAPAPKGKSPHAA